jgi:hypothetical protein
MLVRARRSRSEMTRLGCVQWTRRQYWSKQSGSVVPVDALVDRVEATVSLGIRESCCRLGIGEGSFARAAEDLSYIGGIKLSAEKVRMITEDEGRQVLKWCRDEQLLFDFDGPAGGKASAGKSEPGESQQRLLDTSRADPRQEVLGIQDPVEGKVLRVYASMDGVQTPTVTESEKAKRRKTAGERRRKLRAQGRSLRPLPPRRQGTDQRWKEMKIVTFYNQGSSWRQVAATVGDHAVAGRLLQEQGAKIGVGSIDQIVAPVDGATYIRRQMEQHLPERTQLLLDFFHLGEHVHTSRRDIFGEQSPEGRAWADQQLHTLRHASPDESWQSLLDWRGQLHGKKRRESADALLGYVGERRTMLRYADCDRHGWDVGSGPMESTCKALTRRLKGRGMRWDRCNIESASALESLYQSNQWAAYWKWQLQQN